MSYILFPCFFSFTLHHSYISDKITFSFLIIELVIIHGCSDMDVTSYFTEGMLQ